MLSKRSDGFTLAELLVVVAIIAVLVAIAIPVFTSSLASAQEATCQANRRSMYAEVKVEAISKDLDEDGTKTFFDKLNGEKGPQGTSKVYTCPNNGVWSWTNGNISCSAHSGENEADTPSGSVVAALEKLFTTNQLENSVNSERTISLKDDDNAIRAINNALGIKLDESFSNMLVALTTYNSDESKKHGSNAVQALVYQDERNSVKPYALYYNSKIYEFPNYGDLKNALTSSNLTPVNEVLDAFIANSDNSVTERSK